MIVQAHLSGAVDFGRAEILSGRWWAYYYLIREEISRQQEREMSQMAFNRKLSLISAAHISVDSFRRLQDEAQAIFKQFILSHWPWAKFEDDDRQGGIERMRTMYKKALGDPADPEYKRKIDETVAFLRARVAQAQVDPQAAMRKRQAQIASLRAS